MLTNQEILKIEESTYEEVCQMYDELNQNPEVNEQDLLYLAIVRGEKGMKQNKYKTLEEVYEELLKEDYEENKNRKRSTRRVNAY